MKRAIVALLLSCAACGDDAESIADAAQAVPDAEVARAIEEGDWFVCKDDACSELDTTGLRLSEHQVFHLIATEQLDGHFMEGEPYCVGERFGAYTYEAGIVSFSFHDGGLMAESELAIDDSGMAAHGGDMHKVRENATGRWIGEEQRRCVSED